MPDVQDDSRPVDVADRRPDPRSSSRPDRRGRHEERDQAQAGAQFGPAVLAEPSKHGFNLLAWVLPFAGARARGARARLPSPGAGAQRREPGRRRRRADARSTPSSSGGSTRSSPRSSTERGCRFPSPSLRASSRCSRPASCRSCPATCRRSPRSRRAGSVSAGEAAAGRACEPPVRCRFRGRFRRARRGRRGGRELSIDRKQFLHERDRRLRADRLRARLRRPPAVARAALRRRSARRGAAAWLGVLLGARLRRLRRAVHRAGARLDPRARGQLEYGLRGLGAARRILLRARRFAFVIAGAVFTPAMGVFRWLRDHYVWIRVGGGLVLLALGAPALLRQVLVAARRC